MGRTSVLKSGSKKNGQRQAVAPGAVAAPGAASSGTRRRVMRSSMSPMLQTNEPGDGGRFDPAHLAARDFTSSPPASSCLRMVSTP